MSDKLQFIGGTQPGSQYLVIARDHGVVLAIRAFVEGGDDKTFFALRIRKEYLNADLAGDPNEVAEFTAKKFPGFHLSMKSEKHGSHASGLAVKGGYKDYEALLAFVNDGPLVTGFADALEKLKGDAVAFEVSRATIEDYIRQAYRDQLATGHAAYQKYVQQQAAAQQQKDAAKKAAEAEGNIEPADYSPDDLQKTGFDVSDYMKKLLGKNLGGESSDDTPY